MAAFQVLGLPPPYPFSALDLLPFVPSEALPAFLVQAEYGFKFAPYWIPARNTPTRLADFSIRSILATESSGNLGARQGRGLDEKPRDPCASTGAVGEEHSWIHCTRFRPPKIPKMKREGRPRRTSRSPRVPFSSFQLSVLEGSFQQTRYLSTSQVREISTELELTENRVKIWFQNRRARERRDYLRGQHVMRPFHERRVTSVDRLAKENRA
ncbi:hypothetical protein NDU88_004185 [Pleurodeles waltl]|uniref:Homeobox domain-containing protein n=1 Tax=Pleurodeles waltl TaxID=8319 RepID=A0AAV7MWR8_PLEWA|nr:hypothetical protein NDU88_004185 [Pleurodeles waltl]